MTQATLGIGTKIRIETTPGASPLAFTEIPEVGDIPPLPHTREFVEATNQDSGNSREYIGGLIDAEEFTFECNYLPQNAVQDLLWARFKSGVAQEFEIEETTTSPAVELRFTGIIAAVSYAYPVADKKTMSVTIRRTGETLRDGV